LSLHEGSCTCLQLFAIEHALRIYSHAKVDLLRATLDTIQIEDMTVGLGGSKYVLAYIAEVETKDSCDSIPPLSFLTFVFAHHFKYLLIIISLYINIDASLSNQTTLISINFVVYRIFINNCRFLYDTSVLKYL
jgi:hypothetical protein